MADASELEIRIESDAFSCARLRVRSVRGEEAISRLFTYELEIVSLDHEGPAADVMVGARVAIVFSQDGADVRHVHGIVAEADDRLAAHADVRLYRLVVVPRAFALTLVETQDIFIDMSVPEIVRAKLAAVGLGAAVDMRLSGTYPKREFVVQYEESDLAFVSRLAEHLGISFFFEHGDTEERIVFTDAAAGFTAAAGRVSFRARGEKLDVFELEAKRKMIAGYYAVRDYNYRTPQVDLTADHALDDGFPGGVIEYGAHHKTPDEGKALARIRAEERHAAQLVYTGKSAVFSLAAGGRVHLEGHPDLGSVDLLVTRVVHAATRVVAGFDDAANTYENTFEAIPAERTFRPARVTPRPRIAGLVTGVIDPGGAAPDAKYARIDDQGRYTVRFLFDTTPAGERPASRPVRMVQNHVGENYGTHFPLKPGIEVVIAFVGGDPDRPIIVGAVPNPTKPSPVTNANPGVHRIRTSTGITLDLGE